MEDDQVASLVRITELFVGGLSALILNIAVAKIGMEGGNIRQKEKVPAEPSANPGSLTLSPVRPIGRLPFTDLNLPSHKRHHLPGSHTREALFGTSACRRPASAKPPPTLETHSRLDARQPPMQGRENFGANP